MRVKKEQKEKEKKKERKEKNAEMKDLYHGQGFPMCIRCSRENMVNRTK